MPETELQETGKTVKIAKRASIAYGHKYLEDTSPNHQAFAGFWKPSDQQSLLMSMNIIYLGTSAVNQEKSENLIRIWPEKKDSFTQVDLLDSKEEEVQELIFRIRKSLSIPYRENLANRLLTLFNHAKEEDSASIAIAVSSLRNFYSFLQSHTNLKYPAISLTPDYNIYASWRGEQNRVFSIHFLPDRNARFVIFKPNDRHPEQQIRISGTATTDILIEIIAPYRIRNWISE